MGLVYLVRHGETEWNKSGQFRGQADLSLNLRGLEQARLLANFFSPLDIDAVYSSPLKRARQTAEIIAESKNLKLQMHSGFIDVDYGGWQGLTLKEVKNKFPLLYQKWLEKPEEVTFPGGDNLKNVTNRVASAFRELADKHREEKIVLVAHQAINKILLFHFFRLRERLWEIPQEVAAVNLISFDGKEFKLDFYNFLGHLSIS